ncbi:MAG: T9SS type A sorting domain-containing protein, partial [Ignavibacteria bacterium]|nr:T9SS type A sorting domain-containing protein [Ignavibacteria bacterium]
NDQVVLAAVNENVCWGVTRVPNVSYVTRTTDGGTTWTASNLNSLNAFGSIAAVSADTAWIAANGSIYSTTDGGLNWMEQLTTNGIMLIVRFFDSNNGVCIGFLGIGNSEIYTTTNGGSLWTPVPPSNIPDPVNGEGFIPDNAWVVGNTIWVPTNGNFTFPGSLYKSTDRGITWNVTRPVVNQGGSFCAFKDSLNGLLSSAASNVVKRTTDGGTTWTPTDSIPQGVSPLFMCYITGTDKSYMVTSVNPPGALTGSAYTLDNGETWTTVDNVTHGKAAFVSPTTGWSWGGANVIYKWTGPDLLIPVELISFNSSVEGNNIKLTWQTATEINNQGFEIYRNGNKIAFVDGKGTTTEKQDYYFLDENLKSGIYNYRLNQLDFDGTQEVVGELTVYLTLPEQFSLEQNYPNPFNPSTTISFSIPTSEFVTLKVFDVLGNEVATLANEEKPAGNYKANFNGNELSSGIYFYTLQAGKYVQTKKLILLR